METCPSCTRLLDDGLLYLDAHERPVRDQSKAAWKTCPHCSAMAGRHVYLPFPGEFGTTPKRVTDDNPVGVHSWCSFHRNKTNTDLANPTSTRKTCGGAPVSRAGGAARPPVVRPAGRPNVKPLDPSPEVLLSTEQIDALVGAQVGWIELSEEGRKVLRTHLATERKSGNRRAVIRMRTAKGPLTCDACRANLAERYGKEHAEVVELHHLQPLARGVQKPKGMDDFALLCPTCHRVVHHRREEPLDIEVLRRLIASRR